MFLLPKLYPKNQSLLTSGVPLFFLSGICRLSGAAGPDGYLHAWQDPHTEDLSYPDLPSSLMAEDPREHCDGLVPGGPELRGEGTTRSQVSLLWHMGNPPWQH